MVQGVFTTDRQQKTELEDDSLLRLTPRETSDDTLTCHSLVEVFYTHCIQCLQYPHEIKASIAPTLLV